MEIKMILIGKTNSTFLQSGEAEYDNRLKHYVKVTDVVIPDVKNASKMTKTQLREKEGELILKKIDTSDYVVLLDDKGNQPTSVQLSQWIQKRLNSGVKTLVFVVGGAFGFSDNVYARANEKLSLSRLTFTHQMIRLIFKEQLYRGFTILKGERYHHE
ncbi:MAG: 23S rRNA (pseudouridine(1915)-N(3))-methyltransferase RlmH [Flavobacteriales bacterium]|nr:23S rRNA (pseudouridine(1915)-N(3))-methyltransferase RlmH [Flavobacteriales bacterium]